MEVTIQEYKENKTAEQRAYFHILVNILADETGNTRGDMKEYIKKEVLGVTEVVVRGRSREVTLSSESQSIKMYARLIEHCYILGGELGCRLPPPMR